MTSDHPRIDLGLRSDQGPITPSDQGRITLGSPSLGSPYNPQGIRAPFEGASIPSVIDCGDADV